MNSILSFLDHTFLFLVTVGILYAFYYKTIFLYKYTVGCFQNIIEDERLQNLYRIAINGRPQENIRMTFLKIMYMYVVIPHDVSLDLHLEYLKDHLRYIEEALSVQNLYGLVKSEKRRFIVDGESTEENKKVESIYLIKFKPILQGVSKKKNFFFLVIIILLLSLLIGYDATTFSSFFEKVMSLFR